MSENTERIKEKFIIIYDKLTKPIALSLRNSISKEKESCVVWTEDVYNRNECKLTNRNLLVILNEKMIKDHLANPAIKTVHFSDGVILKHEGNTMGIMVDPTVECINILRKRKKIPLYVGLAKYFIWLLIPYVGVGIYWGKFLHDEKKAKILLLFEAVEKLKTETIEKFLRGEQLD